jgi:hypothetical protein
MVVVTHDPDEACCPPALTSPATGYPPYTGKAVRWVVRSVIVVVSAGAWGRPRRRPPRTQAGYGTATAFTEIDPTAARSGSMITL